MFHLHARPIDDVNAGKLKKELALKQSTVVPTVKNNPPIHQSIVDPPMDPKELLLLAML